MMIRGIAAWLLAMVLLASAAHAHGGWAWWIKDAFCASGRTSCSSPDTSHKIPERSFATISQALPKKYPTGTLTFEHTFPETGKFIGIVTVKNEHGQTYVSQFPFSVGSGSMPR